MTMMATFNLSSFNPGPFILLGIPGLQQFHIWIGIPFFISYPVALVGNGVLLYLVSMERSLHEPMFFFLFMLAATDLILSNTCLPKTFSIFWLGSQEITFSGCLTQMFFHHYSFVMESAIQLAMAFDRYVAICFPLKYNIILTQQIISKIVMGIIIRSFCIIFPCVFLLKRLPFCQTHLIPIMTVISDLILTGISYTLILRAIFNFPSWEARQKAVSTCGSHVCVILIFYTPAIFSVLAHRFGHNIPHSFHILFANIYVAIPPALKPIIYGVKTKKIRKKFILIFLPKGNQ
ncbi:olfactory receptor 52H1-like [Otolemur garnettii]|uniref:olfactory receptor 52H1-like n=1 Tax=Otolemur garnettii TaxID=30611 RepID=UPI000273F3C1|nr:olfactory receptor 52H1-like [Otolemur garnettii]